MPKTSMRADEYAREARRQLSGLEDWMSHKGNTETSQVVNAIYAQALATLTLSEQQRIANLIAMIGLHNSPSEELDLSEEISSLQNVANTALITYAFQNELDCGGLYAFASSWSGAASKKFPPQTQVDKRGGRSVTKSLNSAPALRVNGPVEGRTYYIVDGEYYVATYARILIRHRNPAPKMEIPNV